MSAMHGEEPARVVPRGWPVELHRYDLGRIMERLRGDSLFRNSVALMLTTVVTSLLGYGYWVGAAHLYSADQIGVASAVIAVIGLVSNLFSSGLAAALVQRLPRCASTDMWLSAIIAALALGLSGGIVAALLCAVTLPWLMPPHAPIQGGAEQALLLCGVPVWTIAALVDAIFVAQRRSAGMLARNAAAALSKIALMALAAWFGARDATTVVGSWMAATGISAVGAALLLFPRGDRAYRPVLHQLRSEARMLLKAFGSQQCIGLGGLAWMYMLPVLVTVRLSAAENAYSSVTWMSGGFLFMISSAVSTALFAEGMYAPRGLAATMRVAVGIIGILLAPAVVICAFAGDRFLAVFGPAYVQHGAGLLLLLAVAAVPDAVTNLAVGAWRVQGRLAAAARLNLGMAALSLSLAWIWLPRFGILGAGLAWLAAQGAGCVAVLLSLRRPARRP